MRGALSSVPQVFPGGRVLTLASARTSDSGSYSCVAVSAVGEDRRDVDLQVHGECQEGRPCGLRRLLQGGGRRGGEFPHQERVDRWRKCPEMMAVFRQESGSLRSVPEQGDSLAWGWSCLAGSTMFRGRQGRSPQPRVREARCSLRSSPCGF